MTHPITKEQFQATAYYVGERLQAREAAFGDRLATRPWTLAMPSGGVAVLFRWGAVVFFDVAAYDASTFLAKIRDLVDQPYDKPETETVLVHIDPHANEGFDGGVVRLRDGDVERLQTLANVLGKTVALAQYEADVAVHIDRIEPFAAELGKFRARGRRLRELLHHIGRVLQDEHKLLGRVEVDEKPDLLWERPDLEPVYERLEDEFELRERAAMLDRKLDLIARTVHTALDLVQHRSSIRVEWYIVVLIIVEIFLSVYDLFFRR